jgi:hypothetical protein
MLGRKAGQKYEANRKRRETPATIEDLARLGGRVSAVWHGTQTGTARSKPFPGYVSGFDTETQTATIAKYRGDEVWSVFAISQPDGIWTIANYQVFTADYVHAHRELQGRKIETEVHQLLPNEPGQKQVHVATKDDRPGEIIGEIALEPLSAEDCHNIQKSMEQVLKNGTNEVAQYLGSMAL